MGLKLVVPYSSLALATWAASARAGGGQVHVTHDV